MNEGISQSELDEMKDRLGMVSIFDDKNSTEGTVNRMFVVGYAGSANSFIEKCNLIAQELGVGLDDLHMEQGTDIDPQRYKDMTVVRVQIPLPTEN